MKKLIVSKSLLAVATFCYLLVSCTNRQPVNVLSLNLQKPESSSVERVKRVFCPSQNKPSSRISDSIALSLQESDSFGEKYKITSLSQDNLPYIYMVNNPDTNEPVPNFGACPRITIILKSLSGNKTFSFFEYVGAYVTPVSMLSVCDIFRVKRPDKNSEPYKIKGFNSDGKCIYYFEFIPESSDIEGKGRRPAMRRKKPAIVIPRMIEPT